MAKKKKLLIFYDWFYPGYKAGGPIQSLTNLTLALVSESQIFVVTGAYDLNSDVPYENIEVDKWNSVRLPGSDEEIQIYYATKSALNKKVIQTIFNEVFPDTVCLNGVFSYRFFLLPLMHLKSIKSNVKTIIFARGMLKKGALAGKAFKKKIYLRYLRFSQLVSHAIWLATNQEEANDIGTHFRKNNGIVIAPNIPKIPYPAISILPKNVGQLKLVYLSLINPHKNLLLLLELIKNTDLQITLHIFGPVVDENYWKQCDVLIQQMPGKVEYKGEVQPVDVQQVLSQYHALILFTKGENFGHAIYESLSVGRPVITSHFTPWQNLQEKSAGANVNFNNSRECIEKINDFGQMNQNDYETFCRGAHSLAVGYFKNLDAEKKYRQLFIE